MNYKIIPSEYFKQQVREPGKVYPGIRKDLKELSAIFKKRRMESVEKQLPDLSPNTLLSSPLFGFRDICTATYLPFFSRFDLNYLFY